MGLKAYTVLPHCSFYAICRDNRVDLISSLVLCLSLCVHAVNEENFLSLYMYTVQGWRGTRGVRNFKQLVRCYSAIPPPRDPSSLVAPHLLNSLRSNVLLNLWPMWMDEASDTSSFIPVHTANRLSDLCQYASSTIRLMSCSCRLNK